eukprot:11185892-Lingulodinium_polyedra.AAC.1
MEEEAPQRASLVAPRGGSGGDALTSEQPGRGSVCSQKPQRTRSSAVFCFRLQPRKPGRALSRWPCSKASAL